MKFAKNRLLAFGLAIAIWCGTSSFHAAQALELIMFDASWCGICRTFKSEVLPTYDETEIGSKVPIEVVDMTDQDSASFSLSDRVTGVPTFVLIKDGTEVARFSGYSDPSQFYARLESMARDFLDD